MSTITGRATAKGTAAYAKRMSATGIDPGHYREIAGLRVSSIGIGTYLGPPTDPADREYQEAIESALTLGTNFVDAAVNYRYQRSERAAGAALRQALAAGVVSREEVVLATKGGFIPMGDGQRGDAARWIEERILSPGLARVDEIAASCHCMTPAYLRDQIARSKGNLGVETLDIYYVHNPETQLEEVDRERFRARLAAAFAALEAEAKAGSIGVYGVATWNGFRVEPDETGYLALEEVVAAARDAGGENHRFRVVQLPVNLAMPEALARRNQPVAGKEMTMTEAAARLGVQLVASGSILQGRLASRIPEQAALALAARTDAQSALQFTRSAPGIAAALVGMRRRAHVEENLELARKPPAPGSTIEGLIAG